MTFRISTTGMLTIALGLAWLGGLAGCGSGPSTESEAPAGDPVAIELPVEGPGSLGTMAHDGEVANVRAALDRGVDPNVADSAGRTALMLAGFNGHSEIVRALLDAGATVDTRDATGRTALMYASSGPFAETVRILLDAGADPLRVDYGENFTALMFAAGEGQLEVVQTLLSYGADPSVKDVDGDTAFDFADRKGHAAVARLLSGTAGR